MVLRIFLFYVDVEYMTIIVQRKEQVELYCQKFLTAYDQWYNISSI